MKRSLKISLIIVSLFLIESFLPFTSYGQNKDPKSYPDALIRGKNVQKVKDLSQFSEMADSVKAYISPSARIKVPIKVESVYLQKKDSIYVTFNRLLADYPFVDKTVEDIENIVKQTMPPLYKKKKVAIFCNGTKLKMLANPFYSDDNEYKKIQAKAMQSGSNKAKKSKENPLKQEISKPYTITKGLQNRHIAMQNSHGWFYEPTLDRWEFQRARLYGVVEDTYTMSYVVPFVVPMLENAGAIVLMPKERDWNLNEVIVDNDTNRDGYKEYNGRYSWEKGDSLGFANPKESYVFGENPFKMGSYMQVKGVKDSDEVSQISWNPNIPAEGEYAVYISYHSLPESTDEAKYIVKYNGGEAEFIVNQQIAGGIWVYLGTFYFKEGESEQGVYLSNNDTDGIITADACKFGGGMGNIARGMGEGFISGMPRFMEGARYWLQWSGMPDTVYSVSGNLDDYTDDYVSRGKWVNRLAGGSSVLPEWGYGGLKVPIDLSFAFHTDAGSYLGDTIVGTLSIYTRNCPDFGGDNYYSNNEDRILGRYLADIVQTQLVDDVSKKYGFDWSRRGLWDRSYSESRTPQVPSMLLEFLSHHNFADMKFGLDPDFRFTASRAIYKGILKFLSFKNKVPYIVQPLPVNNMNVILDGDYATVSWSAVEDEIEPTAIPKGYVVYTAINDNGYDRGTYIKESSYRLKLNRGDIYRFKVTAVNDGGESFPSEVVAVGVSNDTKRENEKPVLIVNAFDRVGAPKWLQSRDSTIAGFFANQDHGVPYIKDASYLGDMYEFRRDIPWKDDDSPGFGSCYSDMAGKIIAGNTFDYAYDHGKAFMKAGYSFVSSTRSAVENGVTKLTDYNICDMIMGKQLQSNNGSLTKLVKYAVYTPQIKKAIKEFCANGRKFLLSGAYIATDLVDSYVTDSSDIKFAADVLKFKWMTNFATKDGRVAAVNNQYGFNGEFSFYATLNDKKYLCESPDAFVPIGENAFTIMRYPQTSISAAVAYAGNDYKIVSFGFPIETLKEQNQIDRLIEQVIYFFDRY